jgi:hypothetical protein
MDIQKAVQTAEDGKGTSPPLLLAIVHCEPTLKDDKINVETSELREFLGNNVRNLCSILSKRLNICQRTEQQIHKEIDE